MDWEQGVLWCDAQELVVDKLSEGDKLGPDEAHDASAHAHYLQTMTSTMGKYYIIKLTQNKNQNYYFYTLKKLSTSLCI